MTLILFSFFPISPTICMVLSELALSITIISHHLKRLLRNFMALLIVLRIFLSSLSVGNTTETLRMFADIRERNKNLSETTHIYNRPSGNRETFYSHI